MRPVVRRPRTPAYRVDLFIGDATVGRTFPETMEKEAREFYEYISTYAPMFGVRYSHFTSNGERTVIARRQGRLPQSTT